MTPQPEEPSPSLADVRQWPRRARWAVYGATLLAVVVALGLWDAERGANLAGARPLELPDAPRIWATTAACLGDSAPYPAGVRFYVGDTVPSSWISAHQPIEPWGGYAGTDRRIMFASAHPTDAIVTHELWHVIHGASHPARIFGDATHGPRCGVARP